MTGDEYLKALGVEVWKLRNSDPTIQTEFPDVAVEQNERGCLDTRKLKFRH